MVQTGYPQWKTKQILPAICFYINWIHAKMCDPPCPSHSFHRYWVNVQKSMASTLRPLGDRAMQHLPSTVDVQHVLCPVPGVQASSPTNLIPSTSASTRRVSHFGSAVAPRSSSTDSPLISTPSCCSTCCAFEVICHLLLALRTASKHLQAGTPCVMSGADTNARRLSSQGLHYGQQLAQILLLPWLPQAVQPAAVARVRSLPDVTAAIMVRRGKSLGSETRPECSPQQWHACAASQTSQLYSW